MKGFDPNSSAAASARNWRRVILVDFLIGLGVVVLGVLLAFRWSAFGGALIAALGFFYVFAIVRRYQGFKDRRRELGLDG